MIHNRKRTGFTLVELLMVVCMLSIVSAVVISAVYAMRAHYKEESEKGKRNIANSELVQSLRIKAESLLAEKDNLQAEFDKLRQTFEKGPIELKITSKPDEEGSWWVETTVGNEPEYSMVEVKLHKDRYDLLSLCIRSDEGWIPVDVWLKLKTGSGDKPPRFSPLTESNPFAK